MKLRSRLFYSYVVLLLVYSGFSLLPAPSRAVLHQYNVSPTGLRLIDLTIIVILAIIWYLGFFGYAKLHAYARRIRGSNDGRQMAMLSHGILLLVLWLPLSSVISVILNYFALKHPSILPTTAVINNYISLLLPLAGFVLIGLAAEGLSDLVRQRPTYSVNSLLMAALIYIGLVYSHLVLSTPDRALIYHLSLWPIITTIVAPYVFMWFIGLQAVHKFFLYQRTVKGIVYQKSWYFLAIGLGWLILTSIGVQYLTTLASHLSKLSIYGLLVIIYALLLVLSIGYIFIALGARKLQRIEEV